MDTTTVSNQTIVCSECQLSRLLAHADVPRRPDDQPDDQACWNWMGQKSYQGYGRFKITDSGREIKAYAHRVAWEAINGPIPPGMMILHNCNNASCINPSHLRLGTHAENMADVVEQGRRLRAEGLPARKSRGRNSVERVRKAAKLLSRSGFTENEVSALLRTNRRTIHAYTEAGQS